MAQIKDYVDESGKPKTPEPKQAEQQAEQADLKPIAVEEPEPDDIPEKFKGKSAKDIIQMYQEVEKYAGRLGQEKGQTEKRLEELQKTVDTLILQGQKSQPEEEVDYFSDPEKAIERHPKVKTLEQKLAEYEQKLDQFQSMSAVQQLYSKHPDAAQIAQSSEFHSWVQEETGRQALFKQIQNNDPVAADALLSDYKKSRKPKDNQKGEVKRASTGLTTSSTAPSSRKIYSRRDIRELMVKDPRKYQSMAKEIRQAYAEGRVRD